jgi:NAD-dependent deacetylase
MPSDPNPDQAWRPLIERWTDAARVVVLTGAGISKGSGVPTFRGADGLWRNHRAEELATAQAFQRDPATSWEWYDWRRQMIARCQPNPGHQVIASWSRDTARVTVITQNVDGLHERAGTLRVIRLHGSIWEVRCWNECPRGKWPISHVETPLCTLPPRCPYCDGLLRPGVVWFGEALDPDVLRAAHDAAQHADIFLTVGTSSLVFPAASLMPAARDHGAFTVEINPEATPASSSADLVLRSPAETALVDIDRAVRARH